MDEADLGLERCAPHQQMGRKNKNADGRKSAFIQ